ncbi:MAG TPA: class IV adenylate cyclase [Sediminibacterium sp.]|nr:class IV adenylate cyclase [Sediminibacterium sp.]
MHVKNFEFKAKVDSLEPYETKLLTLHPMYHGLDHQTDTYFNVPKGRLKLREGNIENALINYDRADVAGSKQSDVILYKHLPDPALKKIMVHQLGIKAIVDKKRKIYFIKNVKFHFDSVENLGTFIEVEAIDHNGTFTTEELQQQCNHYFQFFELTQNQVIDRSYSDLLINLNSE